MFMFERMYYCLSLKLPVIALQTTKKSVRKKVSYLSNRRIVCWNNARSRDLSEQTSYLPIN